MNIREISKSDLSELSHLYMAVSKEPPWCEDWKYEWAFERLSIIFNCPGFYGFLVENEGKIIGGILSRMGSFMGEYELEVEELFVSSVCQGKGIGSKLISQLSTSAKENGISALVLLTDRGTPAQEFYLKRDFKAKENTLFMYLNV